ncbi:hypothetical protein FV139_09305 [Parahaliea maris]|uniref:Uncharacterized protein n=1 Tax=Parahaliea maris TaxID=2716870 RepID=A0A5C8ZYZ1_9GAMM|nr:hypothetical protein [Parahaliea maris]TXS93823.1 hypothetical protein FV139_09305 [Parahaliea maris]
MHRLLLIISALFLLSSASLQTLGEDALPPPVNGVSFEEWAAANARLANQQPQAEVLAVLGVDASQWERVNTEFLEALKQSGAGSPLMRRYAEIFAQPAVGRFAGQDSQPQVGNKLATYEDYARVQAHLTVASEYGEDPQKVLAEHDLTVYEFSQETGRWIQARARAASDRSEALRMNQIMAQFEEEYRQRYAR